jgi:hypothetical protein
MKRGIGFWLGVILLILAVLQYIQIPFIYISRSLLSLAAVAAGVYLIIKER